jgi:enoyl-CoA hydratase/carnithine racemase
MTADPLTATEWQGVRVHHTGAIVEVAIDRPGRRNALDGRTIRELTEVARILRLRSDVLAVVLRGGDDYFSAGADLNAFEERIRAPTLLQTREVLMAGPDLCRAWEEIEAITVAAIEGYCVGAACALALACDFRILSEGGFLSLPEVSLGLNMSWRTTPRVVSLIGPARAKRLIMFGQRADAATCLDWGLADEVAPRCEVAARARAWAGEIAALPPIPVRMTKEQVNMVAGGSHLATSYMDRDQYMVTSNSQDFQEGRSAFLQKRQPVFRGD